MKRTCLNCVFNTGVQCHGHGDFWATCNLILFFAKNKIKINNELFDYYDSIIKSNQKNCILDYNDILTFFTEHFEKGL